MTRQLHSGRLDSFQSANRPQSTLALGRHPVTDYLKPDLTLKSAPHQTSSQFTTLTTASTLLPVPASTLLADQRHQARSLASGLRYDTLAWFLLHPATGPK